MNYTMDSVEHAKEVLKEKTKLPVRSCIPLFSTDIKDLNHFKNRYFFGILNIGNNVETGSLSFENNLVINVSTNSQIISLFQSLDCIALEGTESSSDYEFEGSFRGFEIVMG
jgi:hypothetical protein